MEHINFSNTSQVIFDYSKANYPGLINFLSHIDFSICEHLPDIDSIWHFIKNSIIRGMHIFVPKFKLKSSQSPKWFTSNIRHQIKCLRTLRKKYKSRPTEHNLLRIKTAEETLQANIQQAKANFEAKLVSNFAFSNDSKIFQYVRNLTKSASIPSTIFYDNTSASQDLDKANLFNKYFYSVFSRSTYSLPNFENMPRASVSLDSIYISEEDVYDVLLSLDPHKATGIDGISPAILKHCTSVLVKPLHYLFSYAIHYYSLPSEWQIHSVLLLSLNLVTKTVPPTTDLYLCFVLHQKYLND